MTDKPKPIQCDMCGKFVKREEIVCRCPDCALVRALTRKQTTKPMRKHKNSTRGKSL